MPESKEEKKSGSEILWDIVQPYKERLNQLFEESNQEELGKVVLKINEQWIRCLGLDS